MSRDNLTIPNLLSASRLVMAPLAVYAIINAHWYWAAIILWLAIGSDLADGYLARKTQTSSVFGGILDHSSDAIFVSALLFAHAAQGLIPYLLPVLVLLAFLQYMLDSKSLAGQPLRASVLGKNNGILYFVVAGFPIMQHALTLYPLSDQGLRYFSYAMIISTLISMADRLVTLIRLKLR